MPVILEAQRIIPELEDMSSPNTNLLDERGTLVVMMYCQTGLVIRADKRRHFGKNQVEDDQDKLWYYDEGLAFAVTGYTQLGAPAGVWPYNIADLVRRYLDDNGFNCSREFFNGLGRELGIQLYRYLHSIEEERWPPEESGDHEKILFEVFFCCVVDGKIEVFRFYVRFARDEEDMVSTGTDRIQPKGIIAAFGDPRTVYSLLDEEDHALDEIKNAPNIKPYLSPELRPIEVSEVEAIAFTKKLIETSHRCGPSKDYVGPTSDCIVLRISGEIAAVWENT